MKWGKSVRKWMLDALLLNPPPLICFIALVFATVFSIGFLSAHIIDQIDVSNFKLDFLSDNIQGKPSPTWVKDVFPIDVVYTWVNGSDPLLIEGLYQHREVNITRNCSHKSHFPSSYYFIRNSSNALNALLQIEGVHLIDEGHLPRAEFFIQNLIFSVTIRKQEKILTALDSEHLEYKQLCLTTDVQKAVSGNWSTIKMFHFSSSTDFKRDLQLLLKQDYESFQKACITTITHESAYIDCTPENHLDILSNRISSENYKSEYNITNMYLAEDISSNGKESDENRFSDNEELRYSLRSIEKFMPWVRKIFIVTNGQIPYWLNLMHPRLTLVSHSQIYPNASHLPTFSSASIETHLHRIDGLSEHFIYFNDDFFMGQPVWPEDFYSLSSGYQVYISWNLPECSPGCPASWVKDGFCDESCDVSDCDFDGGDCSNNTTEDRLDLPVSTLEDTCASLCPNEWLKDSHCDGTCKVPACGFDAGDCGIGIIKQKLPMLKFPVENQTLLVPAETLAAWFDLSKLGESADITTSYSSSVRGIRLVTVSRASKTAILLLRPNYRETTALSFSWLHSSDTKSEKRHKVTFNISYNTFGGLEDVKHTTLPTMKPESFMKKHLLRSPLQPYDKIQEEPLSLLKKLYDEKEITKKQLVERIHALRSEIKKNPTTVDSPTLENYRGHFPWEKKSSQIISTDEQNIPSKPIKTGRKLLDIFGDMLLHVNKLYNDAYGYAVRKVPAHVPYFLNKSIIMELQDRYSEEFAITSSHKFRQSNDMQLSFAYFYYMMSEKKHRTPGEIFDLIDTDHSGTWSDREIRTFLAVTSELPVYYQDLMEVQQDIFNCSSRLDLPQVTTPSFERYPDSNLPTVMKDLVVNCLNNSLERRIKSLIETPKFKFNLAREGSWLFKMITSNLSQVVSALDDVRKRQRKFICLNNDMNSDSDDNAIVKALVIDLLEALFPHESSFELSKNYRNRFNYLSQLNAWKWNQKIVRSLIYASICCLVILTVVHLFSDQLSTWKRRWCRRLLNEDRWSNANV